MHAIGLIILIYFIPLILGACSIKFLYVKDEDFRNNEKLLNSSFRLVICPLINIVFLYLTSKYILKVYKYIK